MNDHIDGKLATSAYLSIINRHCSFYALRTLRMHGLQSQQLHEVMRATTLNSLLYASTAWYAGMGLHVGYT